MGLVQKNQTTSEAGGFPAVRIRIESKTTSPEQSNDLSLLLEGEDGNAQHC